MTGERLPPPPRRPTPLGIRVEVENAPDSPPRSSGTTSDSRELVLAKLKEVEERAQAAIGELSAAFERRIHELQDELARKDAELEEARRLEHDAGVRREGTLDARLDALARKDEELAARIARIAAPQLEASGAVGAKAVTDLVEISRKRRELVRDVVVGLALAGMILWQLFGKAVGAEAPLAPAPAHPTPAPGPGYGGRD